MRIAVIGSGIAGLGAAWLLRNRHEVTLYERNDYAGGHTHTLDIPGADGPTPVDTGFMVFNQRNYPLLTGLFRHLHIDTQKTDMSFGVSIGWSTPVPTWRHSWRNRATGSVRRITG